MTAKGFQNIQQRGGLLSVKLARLRLLRAEQVSSHCHPRTTFPEDPSPKGRAGNFEPVNP
jgi:hypothetical protein